MGQPKKKSTTKATFRYHSHFKDSISVQRRRNNVNDCEEHEKNPHLQDFLTPHHIGDVKSFDEKDKEEGSKPSLPRPCASILHNVDCPSRHSCEITESNRHISFHQVTVREYDMVLGDHPNCSYGPPVSLGWHYLEYEPLDVNEYEFHHSRRRPLRQLCLNYYRRRDMLLKDYTDEELHRATKEKNRIQTNRSITKKVAQYGMLGECFERVLHKIKKRVLAESVNPPSKRKEALPKGNELDWSRSKFTKESSILKQ
mmetsp:Transcript_1340/g.3354  ORF Transcript_1340/g.3354 Transcript_1340/m.3354 type:complete len:256 (+) Transcript_1340:263-1030(+)